MTSHSNDKEDMKMGMMYAHNIERAATYLLGILALEGKVHYSRFYDGTDETKRRLAEGMGMTFDDAEWCGAEGVMDEAAAALEQQGYVKRNWLDEKLADGEPAYQIELLDRGREMLAAGTRPRFRDLDL
jgi:hypothetical protein